MLNNFNNFSLPLIFKGKNIDSEMRKFRHNSVKGYLNDKFYENDSQDSHIKLAVEKFFAKFKGPNETYEPYESYFVMAEKKFIAATGLYIILIKLYQKKYQRIPTQYINPRSSAKLLCPII